MREETEGKMTEFSACLLCWFRLGWAAGLPGFSHGTNGHLCWAREVGAAATAEQSATLWLCHDTGLGLVPKLALPFFLSILCEYHAKMGS